MPAVAAPVVASGTTVNAYSKNPSTIRHYRTTVPANGKPEIENFTYDPECRAFLRRKGKEVGSLRSDGYHQIYFRGRSCALAHQIVWELHHGPIPEGMWIDHIDGNRSDSRIENLRLATPTQNGQNKRKQFARKYQLPKNVHRHSTQGLYMGIVTSKGVRHQKCSKNIDELVEWVKMKKEELHGDFANHH